MTVPEALPGDVGVEARLDVRKVDLLAAGQHVYTSDGHGVDVCRAIKPLWGGMSSVAVHGGR